MEVRPLSFALQEKAALELNETPDKLERGLKELKEWISQQPHLRARTDDQWLAAFLRGTKHNLARAKEKLDLYYSLRTVSPDLFMFRPTDPRFKYLLRSGLYDPSVITPIDYFSFAHLIQQIKYLEDDAFMVNGTINVIDIEGVTMAHIMQMTPTVLKKLVIAGQDASPLRLKSLHIVNSLPVLEKLFSLVKKLLNEKHRKKLYMHSKDLSALHNYVPPEILPAEYGGQGGTKQEIIDYWEKKLDHYGDWFDEDMKFGTDESKRPGKEKTTENMIGVQGSFRQLSVD
ncbi:hypothetical protein HF086_005725 [Spodoptera exigua]|uniref:CRAL-TRIO domain-containing protein n=1 Tax=Spodoptera exigua TaxID=7107 RepID=A0A922MZI8_SPOEX|nr:hypothetical protein HF086_005725 [Spodoptera exigua]